MDPFLISGDSTLFQHFIDKIALALKGLEEHTSLKCLKKNRFFRENVYGRETFFVHFKTNRKKTITIFKLVMTGDVSDDPCVRNV